MKTYTPEEFQAIISKALAAGKEIKSGGVADNSRRLGSYLVIAGKGLGPADCYFIGIDRQTGQTLIELVG